MNQKKTISPKAARLRVRPSVESPLASRNGHGPALTELQRKAEAQLRKQKKVHGEKAGAAKSRVGSERLLHELQVHHLELEMQNSELEDARDRTEGLLEKYTDFYDFAPVGYLSLDDQGQILEVNLTGAALLGVGRSELVRRRLPPFVTLASRPMFLAFLKKVFNTRVRHVCEALLVKADGTSFWASCQGTVAKSASPTPRWCRLIVSDITALKRVEETQRRAEALAQLNEEFRLEIVRRQTMEKSLRESEQHQRLLLEQSRRQQEQLRQLSRQVLNAQEEERKRISRELHDVIAQTLTGINLRLAALKNGAGSNAKHFDRNLADTQRMVEKSVDIVHRFARELRPAVLDDLGLIAALLAFMETFTAQTGVRTHLTTFAGVEEMDPIQRTTLYRVAQEALTNVARHAHAAKVEVNIQKLGDGGVSMQIKDNGKSFNVPRASAVNSGKRLGLLGMRERVEMVGGTFGIESAPGQGTTVWVEIPFTETPKGPLKKASKPTKLKSR